MKIQCLTCKWFDTFGVGCKAFPEGIPLEITEGEIEHNEVIDGQVGDYVYTEETEADAEEKLHSKKQRLFYYEIIL